MALALTANDLLAGEVVHVSKNANAVVSLDETGLSQFAFGQLMWVVGMHGKEAIGGRLHVTNYRLVFNSHRFNRLRGRFSIFLPAITGVRDASWGPKRQIEVSTRTHRFTFVVWGIPDLDTLIDRLRQVASPTHTEWLARAALVDYAKVGEGLRIAQGAEMANIALCAAMQTSEALRAAVTPDLSAVELAGAMGLIDLLEYLEQT
ncbi:hypothetical protein AB0A98_22560 [Streptomyces chrestomyceticus]|uniref:hypothetical protein n=1 Tax=Streptomyces chrestomyceticus TaxID=68185 RepID=UPI00340F3C63